LDEALDHAVEIFEEGLEHSERRHLGSLGNKFWVVSVGPKNYAKLDDLIDILLRALLRQRRIELAYRKPGSKNPAHYVFEPYTMLVYKQGLYLIGSTEQRAHTFYLAVERILECKLTDQYFDYPQDFSPRQFCEGSFGIFKDAETDIVVRFSSEVAEYVQARSWHPTQEIKDLEDGGIELSMTVSGIQEVIPWVLGFGDHAEVVGPEDIRSMVGDMINTMSDLYSS